MRAGLLSPRLQAMRARTLDAAQEISLVRARAFTEALQQHPELTRALQIARGLEQSLLGLPLTIADDEAIAGAIGDKPKCAMLFPELKSDFLLRELDNFGERELDRFALSDEEKAELRERILPPWDGSSAFDRMVARQGEAAQHAMRHVLFVVNNDFSGAGLLTWVDHRRVLERGLGALVEDARARAAVIDGAAAGAGDARTQYEAMATSARAIVAFAHRHATLAAELARGAEPARARELSAMAEVLARVPEHPARTFREAVQAYWLTFLALSHTDSAMELPLGRLDRLLFPYFRRDLEEGRVTREEAFELLAELFIKLNGIPSLNEYAATKVLDGSNQRLTLTIGGVDAAGDDATSELSLLMLEAVSALGLTQPNLAVRLHPATPEPFRRRVVEVMTGGANLLAVFNDETIVHGLRRLGAPPDAAREYILTGCVQPLPARTYGPSCSAFVNGPKVLELLLNGGAPFLSMSGEDRDLPPPRLDSFEALWVAYLRLLRSTIDEALGALDVSAQIQRELLPNPLLSLLLDGPAESGRDVKAGGARTNVVGVDLIGLGTVVDSLAALRTVVFERRTHRLEEVVEWLKADFEGFDRERRMLRELPPRYGNDDATVDGLARDLVAFLAGVLAERTPARGGAYALGLHSEAHHVYQGLLVMATPDGRRAGEMLSPGCGPTSGMDRSGPTASLRSMAAFDHALVMGGASSNLRFSPALVQTDGQRAQFGALLRAWFQLGGQHLQINVVDTATLRDAQRHPERYQDLMVRVTGYSARFVELTPGTQEEIIRRTEMSACA